MNIEEQEKQGANKMFDRVKAIKYYKAMLRDLEEMKKSRMRVGDYDGIDLGSVVVLDDHTDSKLASLLAKKAEADGYNFVASPVQSVVDGSIATIFKIDNEPEEVRAKREQEIHKLMAMLNERLGLDNPNEELNDSKIVNLDEFRKKGIARK